MKTKKEDKSMQSTVVRIETAMHKALRIAAIEAGISMNRAVNQAVALWLKEQKRKGVKQ